MNERHKSGFNIMSIDYCLGCTEHPDDCISCDYYSPGEDIEDEENEAIIEDDNDSLIRRINIRESIEQGEQLV